jgi:hypothetical protein
MCALSASVSRTGKNFSLAQNGVDAVRAQTVRQTGLQFFLEQPINYLKKFK